MPTVRELEGEWALHRYTDASGAYAWNAYDRQGDVRALTPTDCLAPALLDAPVSGRTVIAMFGEAHTAAHELRSALQAVLDHPDSRTGSFEELDLEDGHGAWGAVRAALRASDAVAGIKASKVTKILHRKRPRLVPIFDSKVAAFYGVTTRQPWNLWPILQAELQEHGDWIDEVRTPYRTPDDRPMSRPRALDIIVWMHMTA